MTQDNDLLSFTLNESLFVEGMHGIEEMLSISLDPDIAIETFHEDIQIRGLIILQGEYIKKLEEQKNLEQENNNNLQIIEKMIETDENQVMFSHRFPVEVTVAENRINDMNDVKVEVVAFDYELPTNNRLNISAELHIHGILNERKFREINHETKSIEDSFEDPQSESFITTEEDVHEKEIPNQDKGDQVIENTKTEFNSKANKNNHKNLNEEKFQDKINEQKNEDEEIEDKIDIQLSETEDEEEVVEDVLFLTDIFADVEEKSVSTMRIHIIQKEDTIESVAKRYDMSALQLMKDNQVNADEMTPGKLVYIANHKEFKK